MRYMKNKGLTVLLALVLLLGACSTPANVPGGTPDAAQTPAVVSLAPQTPSAATPTSQTPGQQTPAASALPAVALTDLMGNQVEVKGAPQQVVSLSPAATEILYALGVEKTLVAVSGDCDYPAAAASLPKVDSLDVSAIAALKPSLVFVGRDYPVNSIKDLQAQGIPVVCADADTYNGVYTGIALTAQLMRVDSSALVLSMQQKVQDILSKAGENAGNQPTALFIFGYENGKVTADGPNSIAFSIIQMAGGAPCAASVTDTYPVYSAEQIKALSPDVLFVSSKLDIEALTGADAFKGLKAVKEGRIYSVDPALVTRPGPRVVDGIETLYSQLKLAANS